MTSRALTFFAVVIIVFAVICPACGSLTLTAHRYCVGCEKMIVLADRVSTYLPLPIGAVGRVLRAA